jgi:hypothetical protein
VGCAAAIRARSRPGRCPAQPRTDDRNAVLPTLRLGLELVPNTLPARPADDGDMRGWLSQPSRFLLRFAEHSAAGLIYQVKLATCRASDRFIVVPIVLRYFLGRPALHLQPRVRAAKEERRHKLLIEKRSQGCRLRVATRPQTYSQCVDALRWIKLQPNSNHVPGIRP